MGEKDTERIGDRRLPDGDLHPTAVTLVRLVARTWGLLALALFTALAFIVGVPQGPEGTLIAGSLQTQVQLALIGTVALGLAVAWRREAEGGALIVLASAAVGVFAAFEYRPEAALAPFVALALPGLAFLGIGLRTRPWTVRVAATSILVAVVAASGLAAQEAYDWSFGPTHPQSPLGERPVDLVQWAWSGGLTPTSVVVNVRLDEPREAHLVVSPGPDPTKHPRIYEPTLITDEGAVLGFEIRGLQPGTDYSYAIESGGHLDRTRVGRLRTPGRGPDSFTIAVGACARTGSNGAVFDAIRRQDPLLYLALGDMYYADINSDDQDRFRDELDRVLTRPAQQALFLSTPVSYVWDDHDFGPNDADSTSPTREAVQAVYREYVPHHTLPDDRKGPIHQAFSLGRVRIILTDGRSERSPRSAPDDRKKSLLGVEQKRWLKDQLIEARGRYPLILLVTSVPWIGEASASDDSWAGYATERRELSRFIADNAIEGVVMLAGDAHMVAIDDGSHTDYSGTGRARVPLLHAAALDRRGDVKGGPYSGGSHPGSGQFGTVTVRDDGRRMAVTLRGLDWTGRTIVEQRFRLPAG